MQRKVQAKKQQKIQGKQNHRVTAPQNKTPWCIHVQQLPHLFMSVKGTLALHFTLFLIHRFTYISSIMYVLLLLSQEVWGSSVRIIKLPGMSFSWLGLLVSLIKELKNGPRRMLKDNLV